MQKKVVLITGASSGIGKAVSIMFAEAGHHVYGGSRRKTSVPNVKMLVMDVRSESEVKNGINQILSEHGRLDILVSNAGTGIAGSVEDTSISEAISQFETNYFGALRVIREVLPIMRGQRSGTIIAVGSLAARFALPFQAGYSASKAALSTTLEAMRAEVSPYGVRVCVIEPGDTQTSFTESRESTYLAAKGSAYSERFLRSVNKMAMDERSGKAPILAAKAIYKAAMSKNPPIRKGVSRTDRFIVFLRRLLPDRFVCFLVGKVYAK